MSGGAPAETAADDADRLAAAVARSEIRDLLARIARLADLGEPEEYADCFTADALWRIADTEGLPMRPIASRGRAGILAGVHERRAAGMQGPGSDTAHAVSTTSIEAHADRATARSLFMFYTGVAAAPVLAGMGRYTDELVRGDDGAWRIDRRSITRG